MNDCEHGRKAGAANDAWTGKRLFWASVAAGWSLMAVGFVGVLADRARTNPPGWAAWFAGAAVVHDGLLAPAMILAGVVVARVVPAKVRGPAQAGLVVSAMLSLLAYPLLRGYGRRPDNPTLQPHPYGRGLAALLIVVWGLVAIDMIRRALVRRRAVSAAEPGRTPPSPPRTPPVH